MQFSWKVWQVGILLTALVSWIAPALYDLQGDKVKSAGVFCTHKCTGCPRFCINNHEINSIPIATAGGVTTTANGKVIVIAH